MKHKDRRKRRLRKFTDTLWVWRDYELTQTSFLGSPIYIIARNGSAKTLPNGLESFQCDHIWQMKEFLSKYMPDFLWEP